MRIKFRRLCPILEKIAVHFPEQFIEFEIVQDPDDGTEDFLIRIEIPESMSVDETHRRLDLFDDDCFDSDIRMPPRWVVTTKFV